ncbi:MAG: hypothetical protein ACI92G_000239 [Candidatus Pelagisphaera sp.]|jgi:hypothetical protein
MKPKFELSIDAVETINSLPESWSQSQYRQLLENLEFDGTNELPEDQLQDYALMALQDLEPDEAAAALLETILGSLLSEGKRQNLSEEITTERQWEEYPDLRCHEPLFNIQILLNLAFPETPQPEIHKVEVTLSSLNQPAEQYLRDHQNSIDEALIVRCLAPATSESSILNRLFEDQIAEGPFPEAEHILWKVFVESLPAEEGKRQRRKLSLFCPIRWTSDLEDANAIECEPFIDEAKH